VTAVVGPVEGGVDGPVVVGPRVTDGEGVVVVARRTVVVVASVDAGTVPGADAGGADDEVTLADSSATSASPDPAAPSAPTRTGTWRPPVVTATTAAGRRTAKKATSTRTCACFRLVILMTFGRS
jgi:hypothetical protein